MEAIATLAGGIAHDFNNILAAILNNTELALDELSTDHPLRDHLEVVHQAGGRGKSLVKQIMSISRQHIHERRPVSLEFILNECLKLLRATLPSTIEIRRQIAPDLGLVSADSTQLHQVILNICTNAADAMEGQNDGILEVRLEEVTVAAHNEDLHAGLHPGSYLKLSIRDTGHGMDRETLERIFVPFFTTKKRGKGTGLGLSVAHGIIKSHGGLLNVESVPGKGTEFHVYLPRIYSVENPIEKNVGLLPAQGSEKILFVDDEPALAFSGQKMLEKLGYQVVAETDSLAALKSFLEEPASYDLVITDQTMPHMTGEMLAVEIHKVRDDVPIILCTGNVPADNPDVALARAQAIGIRGFMHKPYERGEMSQWIRRVLDRNSQEASAWPRS
jgi:CheY-like chemotaxis protein